MERKSLVSQSPHKTGSWKDNHSIKDNTIEKIKTIITIKDINGLEWTSIFSSPSPPPPPPPEWKGVRTIRAVHLQSGTGARNEDRLMRADSHRDKKKQRLKWMAR